MKSQNKKIGNILKLEYGKPLPKLSRSSTAKYAVYGANGIKSRSGEYLYDKPSIIVGRKGSAGELNLTEDKFWPLDVTYYVTFDDKKFDLKYLYNLLNSLNLTKLARGVKPGINRNDIYSIEVDIPDLGEQQRIVKILDEAFATIVKAKENVEKNLRNSGELFESYLKNTFENLGKDWEIKKINKISENLDNRRIPITKKIRKSGKYPYYGASGIVDYINEYIFNENALLVSEDGANLIARSTPIAFSVSGKYWVNNHAHILKFDEIASQRFVEYYFSSIKIDKYVTGAAQPKLNQKMLNSIPIPFPDLQVQKELVAKLDALSEQTKKLGEMYKQKLALLDELKKSLLHQAFTGQL